MNRRHQPRVSLLEPSKVASPYRLGVGTCCTVISLKSFGDNRHATATSHPGTVAYTAVADTGLIRINAKKVVCFCSHGL